jgi:hypothetical protein
VLVDRALAIALDPFFLSAKVRAELQARCTLLSTTFTILQYNLHNTSRGAIDTADVAGERRKEGDDLPPSRRRAESRDEKREESDEKSEETSTHYR